MFHVAGDPVRQTTHLQHELLLSEYDVDTFESVTFL